MSYFIPPLFGLWSVYPALPGAANKKKLPFQDSFMVPLPSIFIAFALDS
jgi:hypothetical protein